MEEFGHVKSLFPHNIKLARFDLTKKKTFEKLFF